MKLNGTGPYRGIVATKSFKKGDLLVELNPDCLICPTEILELTPVIQYLRKQWGVMTASDRRWNAEVNGLNETIMILIFYLLLSDENAHHQSIPSFAHYRINFPFFWPDELIRNFDPTSVARIYEEQKYVRYLHGKIATHWPKGTKKPVELGLMSARSWRNRRFERKNIRNCLLSSNDTRFTC